MVVGCFIISFIFAGVVIIIDIVKSSNEEKKSNSKSRYNIDEKNTHSMMRFILKKNL